MTPEERREHLRRIGSLGGKRTVQLHGTAHMSAIGKRGFQVAKDLGWGEVLLAKLTPTYIAKFGHAPTLGPVAAEKVRIRREARALYGDLPCDRCGARPAQCHHLGGLSAGNGEGSVLVLCDLHHRELHRAVRRAHREARRAS